jgi:hypothetical protein
LGPAACSGGTQLAAGADEEIDGLSTGPDSLFENPYMAAMDRAMLRDAIRSEMRKYGLPDMPHLLPFRAHYQKGRLPVNTINYIIYSYLQIFTSVDS